MGDLRHAYDYARHWPVLKYYLRLAWGLETLRRPQLREATESARKVPRGFSVERNARLAVARLLSISLLEYLHDL